MSPWKETVAQLSIIPAPVAVPIAVPIAVAVPVSIAVTIALLLPLRLLFGLRIAARFSRLVVTFGFVLPGTAADRPAALVAVGAQRILRRLLAPVIIRVIALVIIGSWSCVFRRRVRARRLVSICRPACRGRCLIIPLHRFLVAARPARRVRLISRRGPTGGCRCIARCGRLTAARRR